MRIGIVLPIGQEEAMAAAPSYREIRGIREIAMGAEAGGLDSVWVYDHLLYRFDGETTGMSVAAILASRAGSRKPAHITIVPSWTRSVASAMAARIVQHAWIVAAEPTTPEAVRRVAEAARLARAQRTETANLERSGS